MFTMTPMHASGVLCFLAVGTATTPICSGLDGDTCESVLSVSLLQSTWRASSVGGIEQMEVAVTQTPGCEDWCSLEFCDWEGGASCGKCAFCLAKPALTTAPPTVPPTVPPTAGCEEWCSLEYCDWEGGASCGKCAICPATPAPTPAAPTPPPTPAPPPFVGTSCDARYLRLEDQLSNQAVWQVPESDPQFPPNSRAIADPGATCGDAAQGIRNSCAIYNKWRTFQQVAKVSSSQAVRVIGPSGVQYTDVGQGALGTCYFLATLASIAYNQPKIIENMFPAEYSNLYEQNIYTTRWWLNGKVHLLRVDNQVPAGDNLVPFFTGLSLTKEFWPLILEKTWAKMAGNFKDQEGGTFSETMLAITRAPTRTITDIKTDTEKIWAAMVGAAAQKAPQAAWCKTGKYGLSGGHVYAVLTAEMRASVRAVKVYNPWRSDYYEGSLDAKDKSQGDGTFWMTFEEFQQAFEWYWISEAITDYQTMGYQAIPGKKSMTVSMTVSSEKKFIVCLNWPKERILSGAKCKDYFDCQAIMTVCKDNGAGGCADGSVVTGEAMYGGIDGLLRATIDSGSGTYIATVSTEFSESEKWKFVKELSVTVYSDTAGGLVPMTASPAAAPPTTKAPPPSTNSACADWCDKDWCDWVEDDGSTPCAKCAVCSS